MGPEHRALKQARLMEQGIGKAPPPPPGPPPLSAHAPLASSPSGTIGAWSGGGSCSGCGISVSGCDGFGCSGCAAYVPGCSGCVGGCYPSGGLSSSFGGSENL